MSDLSITVPAELADLMRVQILSGMAGASDAINTLADDRATEGLRLDRNERRTPHEPLRRASIQLYGYEELFDQIGWKWDSADVELAGERELLRELVAGAITDVGSEIQMLTEESPIRVDAVTEAIGQVALLTDLHGRLSEDVAA